MELDNILNIIINAAYSEAKWKKHEYLTSEHILYAAISFDEAVNIFKGCGIDAEVLKSDLEQYFKDYIGEVDDKDPVETVGLKNALNSAAEHVLASGKNIIKFEDILVAIYDQEESYGSYFIKKQEVKRIDILNFITHGISVLGEDDFEEASENIEDESGDTEVNPVKINLEKYAVDLTEKAAKGEIDPFIGREDILKRTIQVLSRRMKNNPIHVGEPGVGKTAVTEGLAQMINEGKVPPSLKECKIYSLDMGALLAGTKYRGDFEERIKKVLNKIKDEEKAIVYIDEIHTIIGAGSISGGAMDASNILKPFLDRGKLRVIGSTTFDEYKKIFERDKALSRRFQKIEVPEATVEDTCKILKGLKESYENFHNVSYTEEAIKAAVELSHKYINDRFLPDKAIDVLDEAGAAARLDRPVDNDKIIITEKDIEKIVSFIGKVPEQTVSVDETYKLKQLSENIKKYIYGQDKAIDTIVRAIKKSRAGFNEENKPVASLLFVGPTGVGKTEIAKQLSENLGISLVRFDMSEYQEKHAVARLIGAPPGYVGYEEGGLLTDAVRKTPHCVLLLDEIEKAHGDILNVLLQIMDYATLTDNTGKKADFTNVILIMTSNAGAREVGKSLLGFGDREVSKSAIDKEVERVFSPEFRNRLDDIIVFNKIDENMALLVAKKAIRQFEETLLKKGIALEVTEECYSWLAKKGFSSAYGAREIIRLVNSEIKPRFVDEVLFGRLSKGGKAMLIVEEDEVKIIIND